MGHLIYSSDAGSNEGVLLVRWPWVSWGYHTDIIAHYECRLKEMSASRDRAIESANAIFQKYDALKLAGAAIPEPPKALERPEFDPVMAAITAKAGPDRRLRAQMSAEVMRSRQAGVPDIEIIQAIEQGVTVDDTDGIVL